MAHQWPISTSGGGKKRQPPRNAIPFIISSTWQLKQQQQTDRSLFVLYPTSSPIARACFAPPPEVTACFFFLLSLLVFLFDTPTSARSAPPGTQGQWEFTTNACGCASSGPVARCCTRAHLTLSLSRAFEQVEATPPHGGSDANLLGPRHSMKRALVLPPTIATASAGSCFMPIQSFDLAQDPLLDLFAVDQHHQHGLKQEQTPLGLHTPPGPVDPAASSLVFLNATLPAPPQLAPPVKRRKRRTTGPPKHVQDLMKLQEQSSSETSDSERGGNVKLQIRKLKNRASAAKSRLKAQARQEQLEKNVVELHRQNAYLRDLVVAMAKASGQPLPVLPQLADGVSFDVAL